jgi:hypothetical protein
MVCRDTIVRIPLIEELRQRCAFKVQTAINLEHIEVAGQCKAPTQPFHSLGPTNGDAVFE